MKCRQWQQKYRPAPDYALKVILITEAVPSSAASAAGPDQGAGQSFLKAEPAQSGFAFLLPATQTGRADCHGASLAGIFDRQHLGYTFTSMAIQSLLYQTQ
jgi:hypothetical protein